MTCSISLPETGFSTFDPRYKVVVTRRRHRRCRRRSIKTWNIVVCSILYESYIFMRLVTLMFAVLSVKCQFSITGPWFPGLLFSFKRVSIGPS